MMSGRPTSLCMFGFQGIAPSGCSNREMMGPGIIKEKKTFKIIAKANIKLKLNAFCTKQKKLNPVTKGN